MTREEQRTELLVYRIKDNCYEVAKKLLKEHDKQIRAEVIDELLDISWHSIDLKDFRGEVMKLKEKK